MSLPGGGPRSQSSELSQMLIMTCRSFGDRGSNLERRREGGGESFVTRKNGKRTGNVGIYPPGCL